MNLKPRPAHRLSPRQCLARCGLAATLALLTGEGMLRVYTWCRGWTANCYAAQLQLFRSNSQVGYDLAPGFCLRSGVFRTSINALGLRGEEISRAKPPGVRRIAVVGESSAFGYLVSDGQEAARLLEIELRHRGLDVDVINGAVPGYNLYQSTV